MARGEVVDRPQFSQAVEAAPVTVPALDGYRLGAYFFAAPVPRVPARVALVHCGVGIQAVRYRRFASFLAASGIPTLLYDYRGIGASRPRSLRGFSAGAEDWAE